MKQNTLQVPRRQAESSQVRDDENESSYKFRVSDCERSFSDPTWRQCMGCKNEPNDATVPIVTINLASLARRRDVVCRCRIACSVDVAIGRMMLIIRFPLSFLVLIVPLLIYLYTVVAVE